MHGNALNPNTVFLLFSIYYFASEGQIGLSRWLVCPVDADCLQCNCLGKLRIGFSMKLAVNCSWDQDCQRERGTCERRDKCSALIHLVLSLAQNKLW